MKNMFRFIATAVLGLGIFTVACSSGAGNGKVYDKCYETKYRKDTGRKLTLKAAELTDKELDKALKENFDARMLLSRTEDIATLYCIIQTANDEFKAVGEAYNNTFLAKAGASKLTLAQSIEALDKTYLEKYNALLASAKAHTEIWLRFGSFEWQGIASVTEMLLTDKEIVKNTGGFYVSGGPYVVDALLKVNKSIRSREDLDTVYFVGNNYEDIVEIPDVQNITNLLFLGVRDNLTDQEFVAFAQYLSDFDPVNLMSIQLVREDQSGTYYEEGY